MKINVSLATYQEPKSYKYCVVMTAFLSLKHELEIEFCTTIPKTMQQIEDSQVVFKVIRKMNKALFGAKEQERKNKFLLELKLNYEEATTVRNLINNILSHTGTQQVTNEDIFTKYQ